MIVLHDPSIDFAQRHHRRANSMKDEGEVACSIFAVLIAEHNVFADTISSASHRSRRWHDFDRWMTSLALELEEAWRHNLICIL